jgi:hypothetical protein
MAVQPLSGGSGDQLALVITPTDQAPGIYQATIRIVAYDPEVNSGNQTIPVKLHVVDQVHSVFLPMIFD